MNTSLDVERRDRPCKRDYPRLSARSGSRVLEIQLIDERSLVRQTETGMWEALGRESKQEEDEGGRREGGDDEEGKKKEESA